MMYDISIIIGWLVPCSRPDLNIWNKEERTGSIVDVEIPMDRNCVKTYSERLKMYRYLK